MGGRGANYSKSIRMQTSDGNKIKVRFKDIKKGDTFVVTNGDTNEKVTMTVGRYLEDLKAYYTYGYPKIGKASTVLFDLTEDKLHVTSDWKRKI